MDANLFENVKEKTLFSKRSVVVWMAREAAATGFP